MKRPRFSLRLLLLIVALCSVLFAWFGTLRQLRVVDLDIQRLGLEAHLAAQERWRRTLEEVAASPLHGDRARASALNQLPKVNDEIAELQRQLEELQREQWRFQAVPLSE